MQYGKRIFGLTPIRQGAMYIAAPALFALLALVIAIPLSSSPVYADHDSMYVECPEAIPEGDWGWMRVRRPNYEIRYVTVFTYNGDYTASSNDYYEYHGERIESRTGENSVWVPVGALEDKEAEHDETFTIGFWREGMWHGCVVTIEDDDTPEITGVEISSRPADETTYRTGESIDVTVNTDFKVEVEGTPTLSLYIGDAGETTWRGARYHCGSGSRTLVFRYRVQLEDRDSDGITVISAASADDGNPAYGFSGNIYAEGTDVPIEYGHSGAQGGQDQQVDGRPYVQGVAVTSSPPNGWRAYRANQTIEITFAFNTDVVVEGEVNAGLFVGLVDLNWRDKFREARYLRGSGADKLVFSYTVRPGDMDSLGIALPLGSESTGFGGDGAITAKGTEVEMNPNFPGPMRFQEHKIDTEPPSVTSVSITSRPANGQAYGVGEVVSVEVEFSEKVTLTGDVRLELDIGGEACQATLQSVPERSFVNSLVFHYTVQQGDEDADGIGIAANSLVRNGSGIHDIAGNSASLSHHTVVADSGQKVDAGSED